MPTAKNLVIVESPAKAKTISKFLGKDYAVVASMGHIRDLPKSEMGIAVDKDFSPEYFVSPDKEKVVKEIKSKITKGTEVWIATDEDREGEAIGWHLSEALSLNSKKVKRIVFHEITKGAILHAIESPRTLNQDLIDAQQARRVLDRLVGYELSPLLWKKIRFGLSAGRVQSVAVRLIVEREREILAFVPEEYWKVTALFKTKKGDEFLAHLLKFDGKKFASDNEKTTTAIVDHIKKQSFVVSNVVRKEVKKNPAAPFTTSTLQMDAARKFGFSVKRTMSIAQKLYEGIALGSQGQTGLITYMRTDSVNLSAVALKEAQEFITGEYGKDYALDKPRFYRSKKGAQEAHEAIRPVSIHMTPDSVKKYLKPEEYKLYSLIWKRTVACQMAPAIMDQVAVDIEAGKALFRANGRTVKFPGFLKVYQEGKDDHEEDEEEGILPELAVKDSLQLKKLEPTQHFTKPPPRYTEASLVKKLEEEGIGRPSTYAPTISTIITRGYIERDARQLLPTDLAMVVTDLLVKHFSDVIDYQFTANMENDLDLIAEGKKKWVPVIKDFYTPFHKLINSKEKNISKEEALKERLIGKDPQTKLDVVVRHGRFGPFVQLGNYSQEKIKEMEEKPRRASLPKGAFFETVTLEEALKVLSLPRTLGKNAEGEEIIVTTGRFGPYIKVGKKNVSLPEDYDPYTVKLEDVDLVIRAAAALAKKMKEPLADLGEDPETKSPILVKVGRFGPYITDGITNVSVPKKLDPKKITHAEAVEMLAKKRVAPKRTFRRKK